MSNVNDDERLELQTEFDRMLAPLKRKIFWTLAALIATLVPLEIVVIFGFLTDSGAFRLQTFHGFAVGLGGLVIFSVSMLMVLLPTKLMSYKAFQMSKKAADSADTMVQRVDETAKKVDVFIMDGRAAFADMREAVKGVKLEELKLTFERKVDELKDTIEESFGANDPVLSQAEIDELVRKAKARMKTGAK